MLISPRSALALALAAAIVGGSLCAAPARAGTSDEIIVFAAASLKNAFDDIARAWSRRSGHTARISFAATSQADSRVILDTGGAEKLLGRGDMLYMAADSSTPIRLQGCFVSSKETDRLVRFWKGMEAPRGTGQELLVQQPLWPEVAKVVEVEAEEGDELLDDAIQLVRRERRASTTLLQRRLSIGYVRAARLMDTLEDMGIVGPAEGRGRSRKILEMEREVPWTPT